ncbi:MAG: hypothetical protein ABFD12_06620, partial [Syntrophorhabdus sp.]
CWERTVYSGLWLLSINGEKGSKRILSPVRLPVLPLSLLDIITFSISLVNRPRKLASFCLRNSFCYSL